VTVAAKTRPARQQAFNEGRTDRIPNSNAAALYHLHQRRSCQADPIAAGQTAAMVSSYDETSSGSADYE
jgi:hypothetical protein